MDTAEKTVLVMEDEKSNLGIPPEFFTEAGYRVETYGLATAGVERSRSLKPGMIVVDMLMPDMPGDETVRELSQDPCTREIPVIVALPPGFYPSGIAALKKMGKQVAALKKPIDLADLRETIEAFSDEGTVGITRRT